MYKGLVNQQLKNVMGDYFSHFKQDGIKVAWCTSVGPAELLRSFGFEVYFPENHGALLGATRETEEHIPSAIKCGYSGHVCSYTTSDIGAWINKKTPLTQHYGLASVPKPDVLVYNTNQCREVEDWFNYFGAEFNVPVLGIHPPRHLENISKDEIDLTAKQMKKLLPDLEKASGKRFDIDRFSETVKLSKTATDLWQEVLEYAADYVPDFSFFDGTIHMGPIVVLRGTREAVEYYSALLKELKQSFPSNKNITKKDGIRIFWDGMPIWGKLRMLSELFEENNCRVVASTYCNSWIFNEFDETKPFESTAEAYTKIFINRSEKAKEERLSYWMQRFKCDGIVYHDSKTCFNNSNAKFGLPQRLTKKSGIPNLIIEGDLCDLRFFSEGQSITKIETFCEQLLTLKSKSLSIPLF